RDLLRRDVGGRKIDAAAAAAGLDEDLGLFHLAHVHAERLPLGEVLGQRDVAAGPRALPHAVELVEGRVALDGRLVDLLVVVDVVGPFAVDREGPLLLPLIWGRQVVERVLFDVELHQRAHRPAIHADGGIAAAASGLLLREVGRDARVLVRRLAGAHGQPDAGQEVARVVPVGAERGRRAVGGEAPAAAAGPDGPLLAADGARLIGRAVLAGAAGQGAHGASPAGRPAGGGRPAAAGGAAAARGAAGGGHPAAAGGAAAAAAGSDGATAPAAAGHPAAPDHAARTRAAPGRAAGAFDTAGAGDAAGADRAAGAGDAAGCGAAACGGSASRPAAAGRHGSAGPVGRR